MVANKVNEGKIMKAKSMIAALVGLALTASTAASGASAATIVNGKACPKANATSTVKVKGVSKTYICKINPSVIGATKTTWTLKTCITYWTTANSQKKLIDEQRALVNVMSEPDKTTYNKELDKSMADLNKVYTAIKANYCKTGL
jgi:hypothetical protein